MIDKVLIKYDVYCRRFKVKKKDYLEENFLFMNFSR